MKKLMLLLVSIFLILQACGTEEDRPPKAHPFDPKPHLTSIHQPTPIPTPTEAGSGGTPEATCSPVATPIEDAIFCNDSHTKVLLCHCPNGQPENRELLCLKEPAARAHLTNHVLDFLVIDHDTAESCTDN